MLLLVTIHIFAVLWTIPGHNISIRGDIYLNLADRTVETTEKRSDIGACF